MRHLRNGDLVVVVRPGVPMGARTASARAREALLVGMVGRVEDPGTLDTWAMVRFLGAPEGAPPTVCLVSGLAPLDSAQDGTV